MEKLEIQHGLNSAPQSLLEPLHSLFWKLLTGKQDKSLLSLHHLLIIMSQNKEKLHQSQQMV